MCRNNTIGYNILTKNINACTSAKFSAIVRLDSMLCRKRPRTLQNTKKRYSKTTNNASIYLEIIPI
jgi:hypothetical protein